MDNLDIKFMKVALNEAKKAFEKNEVPVGAVIVKDNKIIAKAHTLKEIKNDPLKHAELIALKKAAVKLKTWKLNDCTIYTTLEPCELCSAAIVSHRIKKVIYALKKDNNNLSIEIFKNSSLNHKINQIEGGLLEEESKNLIQKYFKRKRECKI